MVSALSPRSVVAANEEYFLGQASMRRIDGAPGHTSLRHAVDQRTTAPGPLRATQQTSAGERQLEGRN